MRSVKKRYIKFNLYLLLFASVRATHHIRVIPVLFTVPLSSTRVSDHSELTNHPLLITRKKHSNAPVIMSAHHFLSNACQCFTHDLHWVIFSTEPQGFISVPSFLLSSLIICVGPRIWITSSQMDAVTLCLVVIWLELHMKMWFFEFFEAVLVGHIHLNAVSAPA